ncbi:hypothetical protein PVAP13_3KG379662 [Panicum virgatum]|uniref:Pyridoxal phosphate homeostasis protein n=1 Tax=Panicum virgatum TaxID=38727 RepID=A0A8T0UX28_PANVG|nr:hypothetical protein PVAP13_3KG379662 [Panicum virgatum]KAG2624649.1 hypothetical protein PVAP13_3KG379662 [Panicum virgatum]
MASVAAAEGAAAALRSVLSRARSRRRRGRVARRGPCGWWRLARPSRCPSSAASTTRATAASARTTSRSSSTRRPSFPRILKWHFIGNLQSNKARALLAGVPNLHMVESVDDEKIANRLDRVVADLGRKPLKVLVQVNTSGEESKFGVDPSGCAELAKHVKLSCPNLVFSGLMTIGMLDYSSTPENFKTLANCRKEVCKELGIPEEQCELSMGMSADFEQAIEMGSTNVRVGSTIFGAREYPKKN